MSRLRFTAALALTLASGAAYGEVAGEKPGFLASLLGLKPAQPSAPMAITVDPATSPKVKAGVTDAGKAKAAPHKAPADAAHKSSHGDKAKAAAKTDKAPADKTHAAKPAIDPKPADAVASATPPDATIDPVPPKPVRKAALGPFRGGGSQPVCVRTCDGFFFPVNYEGAHNGDRYAEACQSSCPAAITEVYFMPRGADLKSAATARGERYTALPAAFKYRKERDATCTCKAESQTWGEVLTQADTLIRQDKRDILVTPEKSAELARPVDPDAAKPVAEPQPATKKSARTKKAKPVETQATAQPIPANTQTRAAFSRDLIKGDPNGAWKNTNKFMKVDPEPTASIRTTVQ